MEEKQTIRISHAETRSASQNCNRGDKVGLPQSERLGCLGLMLSKRSRGAAFHFSDATTSSIISRRAHPASASTPIIGGDISFVSSVDWSCLCRRF